MARNLLAIVLPTLLLFLTIANPIVYARPRRPLSLRNASPRFIAARDDPQDPCAFLFEENDVTIFKASHVWACTITIPFNATVASQFLQYYKDTVVFQNTLSYLGMPTASYQQPAVDILGELNLIQSAVDSGIFTNEFDFEQAVLKVVHGAHEGHLWLNVGATAPFSFGSSYAISSVSLDGFEPPKPYLTSDLLALGSSASPISEINGVDAIAWLTQFAAENSFGLLDPNSDWNALMQTPAGDIQIVPTAFTGHSPFFPGHELNFKLENGTPVSAEWLALIDAPSNIPPIQNAFDFFQFFVLGLIPDEPSFGAVASTAIQSAAATATDAGATGTAVPSTAASITAPATPNGSSTAAVSSTSAATNWYDAIGVSAYPTNPVVVQPDLGNSGFITGYFLDDDSTAVLSIPSFEITGSAVLNFSTTIGQFISHCKAASKSKIVIDLQQNYGGNSLLAVDAFKQFFPGIDPFGGSRMRDSEFSNALGTTFTQFAASQWSTLDPSDKDILIDLPWEVLDFTNAETNESFTSWPEFFGPHEDHGDQFSTVQRDNLSDTLFDKLSTGGFDDSTYLPHGMVIYGYGDRSNVTPQPFAAQDILLLTDGICHSSCALFVEMMRHEAGVKTVVVGGRPNIGPMQAVAGTRGAASYTAAELDNDITNAIRLNHSAQDQLPVSHPNTSGLWVRGAPFNLRDQVRENEFVPLQFAYEAADCRIYWNLDTFNNFDKLWQYAAEALWTNSSKCVKDSTIFASNNKSDMMGPSQAQLQSWGYGSPSPIAVLPPHAVVATPVPLAQRPEGQPIMTVSASPVAYNPIPTAVSAVPAPFGNGQSANLANDVTQPQLSTLNTLCKDSRDCNRPSETCAPATVCDNGEFTTQKRCKKICTQKSDCGRGLLICNLFDVKCFIKTGGTEDCEYLKNKAVFVGSGSTKSTVFQPKGSKSSNQYQWQGFCENLVPEDTLCENLIDADRVPLGGVGTVVVDNPVPVESQTENDYSPIIDPDAAMPGGQISGAIMAAFGN